MCGLFSLLYISCLCLALCVCVCVFVLSYGNQICLYRIAICTVQRVGRFRCFGASRTALRGQTTRDKTRVRASTSVVLCVVGWLCAGNREKGFAIPSQELSNLDAAPGQCHIETRA